MNTPSQDREESAMRNFEGWVMSQRWFIATIGLSLCTNGREYNDPAINSRWQGWRAAIAYAKRKGGEV
jgi:hypothetical protein